jgi:hypothetical protein
MSEDQNHNTILNHRNNDYNEPFFFMFKL